MCESMPAIRCMPLSGSFREDHTNANILSRGFLTVMGCGLPACRAARLNQYVADHYLCFPHPAPRDAPALTPSQVVLGLCVCLFVSALFVALCWRMPLEAVHMSSRSQRSKSEQRIFSRNPFSGRKGSDHIA
jgi:hypothetical protein